MRRFLLPGLVAAAAVALLALLTFGVSNQNDTSSIDSQVARGKFPAAPNARQALPVLGKSGKASLADFRGKVVVMNVFASWCDPCQAEAPVLAKEQSILAKHNATLVGITYEDLSTASEQFAKRFHITYPVLRDVTGSFVRSFGTTGVPETFVINRKGEIQALQRLPVTTQWLDETLPRILAEKS
ncbi:MAG TPA: TlpA disulfide reductase family protein [Solirubrobacteraceae bacterium]|jgi:cytochrome c biogenesis protein CcmG/thiol:disulfide interchange protein DsbE|nr:TlpA disulfide reductase family protein [Solirubrobacteraceae bacterium]